MLLLLSMALAAEPPLPMEEGGMEIVVEEILTTPDARAELDQAILEHGYRSGMRVGNQTVYLPGPGKKGWPTVIVHDEGYVTAEAHASFGVSPRLAMQLEERLLESLHPAITAWRRAMQAEALKLRRPELLGELEALRELPREDQMALVQAIWWNTADTPEGQQVRFWVEDWALEALGEDFVRSLGVRYEHEGPPPDWSELWARPEEPPDAVEEAAQARPVPNSGLSRDILMLRLP